MPTAKCSLSNGPVGNILPCSSISLVKRSFRMASILCPLWNDHPVVCCESSFGLTENYRHFTCQLRVNVYRMSRAGEAANWQRGTEMWSQESRENALAQNTLMWSVAVERERPNLGERTGRCVCMSQFHSGETGAQSNTPHSLCWTESSPPLPATALPAGLCRLQSTFICLSALEPCHLHQSGVTDIG